MREKWYCHVSTYIYILRRVWFHCMATCRFVLNQKGWIGHFSVIRFVDCTTICSLNCKLLENDRVIVISVVHLLLEVIFYQNTNAGIIELKFYEQSENEPTLRLNAETTFALKRAVFITIFESPIIISLCPSNFVFNYTPGWTADCIYTSKNIWKQ